MDAILTFHAVDERGSVLSYAPAALDRLLGGLRDDGVAIVRLDELWRPVGGGGHRVVLTFDDGMQSVLEQALPVLERHRAPALLYAVAGWLGRDNGWPGQWEGAPRVPLMDADGLRRWCAAGHEVGGHTVNHARLPALSVADCRAELRDGRARLEDCLGRPVVHFAYPYGAWNPRVRALAGEEYGTAVTTRLACVDAGADPLALPRLDTYYLRGWFGRGSPFRPATRLWLGVRAAARWLRRGAEAA